MAVSEKEISATPRTEQAFTLVELAIVLVIIGLIVGGVLVGRDLIEAATINAQISQINKYNAATNTFRLKYGSLPGDISNLKVLQFGFATRGTLPGQGDGDGVIKGYDGGTGGCGYCQSNGEILLFWSDLSAAHLISETFTSNSATWVGAPNPDVPSLYLPAAKIGNGNLINVWSGGINVNFGSPGDSGNNGKNYYQLSKVTSLAGGGCCMWSSADLSVQQAYNMDIKVDDGMPQSGVITAQYLGNTVANTFLPTWAGTSGPAYATSVSASATTCMDNGGGSGAMKYSVGYLDGNSRTCALSFQFQ